MSVGVPAEEHGVAAVRGSGADLRWFAVGASSDPNARVAGAEAAARALAGDDPKLFVVFCADSYDLDELLLGIAEQGPDVPLIGCSTAGEISSGGPDDSSVVVTALGGPGFTIATAAAEAVSSRLREAGAELAQALDAAASSDAGSRAFLILTDGLCGDQDEIVAASTASSAPASRSSAAARATT